MREASHDDLKKSFLFIGHSEQEAEEQTKEIEQLVRDMRAFGMTREEVDRRFRLVIRLPEDTDG